MQAMRILATILIGMLLPYSASIAAQESGRRLLSTTSLAHDLHALQGPGYNMPTDRRALKQLVSLMRGHVQAFIIRQIEAYPSISACELQKQLATALGSRRELCSESQEDEPGSPRVFAESWGTNSTRRLFAVTYGWFGFYGKDGSQTIIESYVWERDRSVHLASGIVPSMFNGFLTNSAEVCWFADADKYWVLVGELSEVVAGV